MARLLFLALLLLHALWDTPAKASEHPCLKLSYYSGIPGGEPISRVIGSLYQRAGLCADMVGMPLARAGQLLLRGELDADPFRTETFIAASNGQVIAVPTPLLTLTAHVLTRSEDSWTITSAADLTGKRIGLKIGIAWARNLLDQTGATQVPLHQLDQLLTLLKRGRLDGILLGDGSIALMKSHGMFAARDFTVSAPIMQISLFHAVHKRHENLVPLLDKAVREMQKDQNFRHTIRSLVRASMHAAAQAGAAPAADQPGEAGQ